MKTATKKAARIKVLVGTHGEWRSVAMKKGRKVVDFLVEGRRFFEETAACARNCGIKVDAADVFEVVSFDGLLTNAQIDALRAEVVS